MDKVRDAGTWLILGALIAVPIALAVTSPLLAWREPIYIAAGLAGVVGLCLILLQPLIIAGSLPGITRRVGRTLHPWLGGFLVLTVIVHIVGLWFTSPPDVLDALLFRSPTWFSVWGVIAMWSAIAAALLVAFRGKSPARRARVRRLHVVLTTLVAITTIAHAILIEGTMEFTSKLVLCTAVLVAMGVSVFTLRSWR
ncbi:MAG: ferric reductase [Pseudomonadota bacterium]